MNIIPFYPGNIPIKPNKLSSVKVVQDDICTNMLRVKSDMACSFKFEGCFPYENYSVIKSLEYFAQHGTKATQFRRRFDVKKGISIRFFDSKTICMHVVDLTICEYEQ